ncbi:type III effector HopR1, partial [Pseudomonas amygdali pv. mori str. 301020]
DNLGISGTYQHGQGAAVIIAPSTISDFVLAVGRVSPA